MSFGTLLKEARKKSKLSQDELAKILEINRVSISNYEKDKNTPTLSNLKKIQEALNLSSDYFDDENKIKVRTIPLIGLASCGVPQSYALDGYEPVVVSADIYKDGMYAVRAEGDSMSPKINHGNIVYCLANEIIDNGHIIHYTLNGESGIKKYKINEKGTIITLIPLNSKYDVVTIHENDPHSLKMAKVVGVVDTDF